MSLDCTCDYQSKGCKAYCRLLQPIAHAAEQNCFHMCCRSWESDPLRELNKCCDPGCECLPRARSSFKTDFGGRMDDNFRRSDLQHFRQIPDKYSHNIRYCNLQDGSEWNSLYARCNNEGGGDVETDSKDSWKDRSLSFKERDHYSAVLREKYIQEMETLKTKLNLLKNGVVVVDGKRMRRRSESEPGYAGSTDRVVKRPRDISPPCTRHHKLTSHSNSYLFHSAGPSKNESFRRETKSVPPTMRKIREYSQAIPNISIDTDPREDDEEMERYSDAEGSLCAEEAGDLCDVAGSEDDDYSLMSGATSISNNSNTPSQVGECLGSISLCETSLLGVSAAPHGKICYFRSSLFANVPPYIIFAAHDTKGPSLPPEIVKHLKWKLSTITPIVIRRTLINSGFKLVRKSNDWVGQWGKHMNSFVFKTLKDFQKLNHFPGTFQIGRKDRLWKNLNRLMLKYGKKEFGFIPTTYILPQDNKILRTAWEKSAGKGQWILKPPAAARGTGIRVVHRWSEIPKNKALIVQKYIAQPYLINGSKFDLRLYVLMTSIHPLRIYLYDDGLVRFASVKYSDNVDSLGDRFMHLTNYSINKLSTQYCANEDASSCQGHKWTLKTLWLYLQKQGVNVKALQKNMTDLVIKTIISGESQIQILTKNNLPSRYCSYELFGIDVLLDSTLRPWVLEVNISPSLHSSSPLDLAVKGPLVRELLNIAGFQIPSKLTKELEETYLDSYEMLQQTQTLCYDKRLYCTGLSREERIKHASHNLLTRKQYLNSILENLTPDDVRHLIQFEDELTQVGRFEKVFPTPHTHIYHHYFDSPRYYNMMLDAWETKYHKNRAEGINLLQSLCQQNLHLQVPFPGGRTKSSASQNEQQTLPSQQHQESDSYGEESEVEDIDKQSITTGNNVRVGKRRKASVLARPQLWATPTLRRLRNTNRIDRAVNTEPPVTVAINTVPNLYHTCKLESNASAGNATQISAFDIRSSS